MKRFFGIILALFSLGLMVQASSPTRIRFSGEELGAFDEYSIKEAVAKLRADTAAVNKNDEKRRIINQLRQYGIIQDGDIVRIVGTSVKSFNKYLNMFADGWMGADEVRERMIMDRVLTTASELKPKSELSAVTAVAAVSLP